MSWIMKTSVDGTTTNSASDIRKQTEELKRQNAKKKSEIMKPRRPVLVLLDQDPPFIREIRDYAENAGRLTGRSNGVCRTNGT